MQLEFTPKDIAEARRLNRKLAMMPRLRMETAFGRIMLNMVLRVAETYPLVRGRRSTAKRELKSVQAFGTQVKITASAFPLSLLQTRQTAFDDLPLQECDK